MAYALIGDETIDQLEMTGISRNAMLLAIEGIVYCSKLLTDGHINVPINRISNTARPNKAAQELVDAGVWQRIGSTYVITGYLEHQRPASDILKDRERNKFNKQRSRLHKQGDHSTCTYSNTCKEGVLDWQGQPLQGKSSLVTGDGSRPILSNPIQSNQKGWSGKDGKQGNTNAQSSAPNGRGLIASHVNEPHVFVDYEHTDSCRLCTQGEKSKLHQRKVPEHMQSIVEIFAEEGIAWKAFLGEGEGYIKMIRTNPGDAYAKIEFQENTNLINLVSVSLPESVDDVDYWFKSQDAIYFLASRNLEPDGWSIDPSPDGCDFYAVIRNSNRRNHNGMWVTCLLLITMNHDDLRVPDYDFHADYLESPFWLDDEEGLDVFDRHLGWDELKAELTRNAKLAEHVERWTQSEQFQTYLKSKNQDVS
jgi:hypothetical protein